MKRVVPNVDPAGNDLCLDPIAIRVPVVLIDNGIDCFWYPHTLDETGVKQVDFLLRSTLQNEVMPLSIDLILPSANAVCSVTRRFESLCCLPVRATIVVGGDRK